MSSCRVLAVTASVLFAALAGCGESAPEQSTALPGTDTPARKPKAEALPREMVAAVAAGKNFTAISVHFALGSPPTVATPLPVQIAIVPHQAFTTVRAHFESHDGLTISTGQDFGPTSDAPAEKPILHQLLLLPAREGMFMVTATVETLSDEGNVVRIFSIPVIVGPETSAAAPAPAPDPAPAPAPAPAPK